MLLGRYCSRILLLEHCWNVAVQKQPLIKHVFLQRDFHDGSISKQHIKVDIKFNYNVHFGLQEHVFIYKSLKHTFLAPEEPALNGVFSGLL